MNVKNIQKILDDKWFDRKVVKNDYFIQWAVVSAMGITTSENIVGMMSGQFKALYLWFDAEIEDKVLQRMFNHYYKQCASRNWGNCEYLDKGKIYHIYDKKLLVLC